MSENTDDTVGPTEITTREEFGDALTAVRTAAGLSIRDLVDRSGALHGTVAGWSAGQHLPTRASTPAFTAVLAACGVTDPDTVEQWLAAAVRIRRSGVRRRETPTPYRGLAPFREEDAEWFFGRDDTTADLLGRVRAAARGDGPRIVLVIGPSGSGKSSLLRAGLAAAITGDDELGNRHLRVLTPAVAGVDAVVDALTPDGPTVLVVDQFEELWTVDDPAGRTRVIDGLGAVGDDIVVVLGLRADFYAQFAREPQLVSLLESGPLLVRPLTSSELESVIVQPATKVGVTVPDELVRVLLTDLAPRTSPSLGEPGVLPLLSHVLLGMWGRATRRTLTVADYLATGGISGAVQQTAEHVFAELTDEQRVVAHRIFLRLVNVDDDTQSRRRAPRSELEFDDADPDLVDEVVDLFAEARLLTVDEDSVQLSHEVLLTAWDRLRDWIDTDRVALSMHRGITRSAREWQDNARDDSILLGGGRLGLAEEWVSSADLRAALNPLEQQYIEASVAHRDAVAFEERRRHRRLRRLVGALAVVSVIAVVLTVAATAAWVQAQRARDEAMSRQIATMSAQLRTVDPALAAQLALTSYEVSRTSEARSALLDATAVRTPTRIEDGGRVAVLVDAQTVVSATWDGSVRLWQVGEVPSTTPMVEFAAADDGAPVYALAVSSDGARLAVGGEAGVSVWNIADRRRPVLEERLWDGGTVYSLAFDPSGRHLVVGTGDATVLRWTLGDGAAVERSPLGGVGTREVFSAFSPDGRWLVTAGTEGAVRVWDAARWDDEMVPVFDRGVDGTTENILAVTFSPDSRTLVAGTTGRRVVQWSVEDTGVLIEGEPFTGFSSYVNAVSFDTTGRRLAAGGSDNSIRIWNPVTGGLLGTMPGSNPVTATEFSPSGQALLTSDLDGTLRWWRYPGAALPAADTVFTTPFDSAGDLLLLGVGRSHSLPLWNMADPFAPVELPSLTISGDGKFSGASALSADGRFAAGGTDAGVVHVWDLTDRSAPVSLPPVEAVNGLVGVVSFDPSVPILAMSAQSDNIVTLLDVSENPVVVGSFDAGGYPQMMSWHPDEHLLAVSTAEGIVGLWDVSDPSAPRSVATLEGFDNQVQAVAYAPSGDVLAAASADRTIRLWDVSDPSVVTDLARIIGPSDAIYSLDFSTEGSELAAGVGDGTAWVWDVSEPAEPVHEATLYAYGSRVYDATFGSGDRVLAGGGPDGRVRLWILDPDEAIESLCSTAGTLITEEEWDRYLTGVPYRAPCGGE